jgi:hypothetical protein
MASTAAVQDGWMARAALRSAAWAEKWFPDAYVFAVLGVVIVALAAMGFGSTPQATASAFGDGFWSLIPFTMQMAFVVIGGYAVATRRWSRASSTSWCRVPVAVRWCTWAWSACWPRCSAGASRWCSVACWCARWPAAPNCAWTTARPVRRRISAWARCGRWG